MGIVDTPPKGTRGVEVVDTDQQCLSSTGTYTVRSSLRLRSHAHIESTGRKAFVVHLHVHLASEDHTPVVPMVDGLYRQYRPSRYCGAAYSVPVRKVAGYPAVAAEACILLQSADNVREVVHRWEEEHYIAVLGSFQVPEEAVHCGTLLGTVGIVVEEEGHFRIYY
jgi:hypothetical protein